MRVASSYSIIECIESHHLGSLDRRDDSGHGDYGIPMVLRVASVGNCGGKRARMHSGLLRHGRASGTLGGGLLIPTFHRCAGVSESAHKPPRTAPSPPPKVSPRR